MDFFPPIELDAAQTQAIARGLYTVAAVDGLHPKELALIKHFAQENGTELALISPDELAQALPEVDARLLFMKMALMVAHIEGGITPEERVLLAQFSLGLELSDRDLLSLDFAVIEGLASAFEAPEV